jgi:gliding motility-associated-like protein
LLLYRPFVYGKIYFENIIFALLFQSHTVIGQKIYYQDILNGGVTGGGYNPTWNSNSPGVIQLYIEPGSTIRKAFLLVGMYNNPTPNSMQINGTTVQLDNTMIATETFTQMRIGGNLHYLQSGVIDITNLIDVSVTTLNITPPVLQPNINIGGRYVEFYLYVVYENPLLTTTNALIVLNEQNSAGIMNYSIYPNTINLSNNVGFALQTSSICDTINDGSYVSVDGTTIGLIGGVDENTLATCAGVTGSFYYQNGTLFGLSDDVANSTMAGSDAIANIESYINNVDEINIEMTYQSLSNPPAPHSPQTNPVWHLYLTYTTPCDIFQTDLVTEDTTICSGQPLQLGASGGINYNWLPQTGLSCYDCPNPEFVGDSSMVYTVRIWSTDSCSKVLPVKVKVLPQPEFSSINLTPSACGEENGTIVATASNGTAPYHYQLDGGANVGNGQFSGLASSNYTLTVTDNNGCSADSTVFINEEILVNASFTLEPPTGSAPLWVQSTNASTNATNYLWSWANETSTDTHPGFMLDTSGTYTVTLIAFNNFPECADTFSVQVVVYDSLHVVIPNVFTPNNDQSNDFFGITTNVTTSGTVVILNRWGNVMLEHSFSTQPHLFTPLWDGKEATEGVYFYSVRMIPEVSGQGAENEEFEYSGFVTLVR